MDKKKYFEYILPVLQPVLIAQGFKFIKSKDAFEKKIVGGWIRINFFFHHFGFANKVNMDFSLRIDALQNIFVKYRKMNPSNYKDTASIGFALTSLLGQDQNGFEFETVGEIDELLNNKFIPFLQTDVPNFSQKYNNIEAIFNYYYSPEKSSDFMDLKYNGHVLAVIAAKLLNRSDFSEVVAWADKGLLKLKQKWPSSNEVELYDTFFGKMVIDLKNT